MESSCLLEADGVEALRSPGKIRYLVFCAVAGIHALVLGVLLRESLTARLSSLGGTPLAAFILRRPARPRSPAVRPSLSEKSAPIEMMTEPITVAPPVSPATAPSRPAVDWDAAARKAASATLETSRRVTFGFPPGGKSAITLGVPSPPSPAHYAGESDRTVDGEVTEWISARCYIISDPPPLGSPASLGHAGVTRGGCLPPPGPDPGELFKSLPAYKRYHAHRKHHRQ
jgi:hypothetical protein